MIPGDTYSNNFQGNYEFTERRPYKPKKEPSIYPASIFARTITREGIVERRASFREKKRNASLSHDETHSKLDEICRAEVTTTIRKRHEPVSQIAIKRERHEPDNEIESPALVEVQPPVKRAAKASIAVACWCGKLEDVKAFIKEHRTEIILNNPEVVSDLLMGLIEAVGFGHREIVECLLQFDAVRMQANDRDNYLLQLAFGVDELRIADRLLNIDIVTNSLTSDWISRNLTAISKLGYIGIFQRLLELEGAHEALEGQGFSTKDKSKMDVIQYYAQKYPPLNKALASIKDKKLLQYLSEPFFEPTISDQLDSMFVNPDLDHEAILIAFERIKLEGQESIIAQSTAEKAELEDSLQPLDLPPLPESPKL